MSVSRSKKPFKIPRFWWTLSEQDKYQYQCLQLALSVGVNKNQRNQRLSSFKKCIDAVKSFAIRGDCNDAVRCYVCGIIWINDAIAVNTHYLKHLIGKCKSSINGSLQKMGYNNNMSRSESANTILQMFPSLKESGDEIRKWSVRRFGPPSKPVVQKSPKTVELQQVEPVSIKSCTNDDHFHDSFDFDFQTDDFTDSLFFAPY